MNELYREMVALERKVDRLYNLVINLDRQMGELLVRESKHSEETVGAISALSTSTPAIERSPINPMMQHKDILVDGSESDIPEGEIYKSVSPELQIRRLTAQVTAAYNRIATLEEQLLAHRVSSHSQSR